MRGKLISTILLGSLLLNGVFSEGMTATDIINFLLNTDNLNQFKDTINGALSSVPSQVLNLIGGNRIYNLRIGSISLGATLNNNQIISINKGAPSNPTHIMFVSMDTVLSIANAEDPTSVAVNAILNGDIVIIVAPQCALDSACDDDQVCISGQCKEAYTIAVVPIGYSANENQDFYDKAKPEMDLVKQHIPMNEQYLRIHYVNPSICADNTCTDVCRDCQNTATTCARNAGLVGTADKVVGISKDDVMVYVNGQPLLLCGCAGGIPAYTSVSRSRLYVEQGVYCYQTVVHELGHQLGLYHVDAVGNEGGACQGPNAADCQESNKASDIMGYGWPQDHFGPTATNYLTTNVLGDYQ